MGTHGLMGYLLMRVVAQLNSVFNILIFSAEDGESRDQKDGGEKAGEMGRESREIPSAGST